MSSTLPQPHTMSVKMCHLHYRTVEPLPYNGCTIMPQTVGGEG